MQRILLVLAATLALVGLGLTLLSSGDPRADVQRRGPEPVVQSDAGTPTRDPSADTAALERAVAEPRVSRAVIDAEAELLPLATSSSRMFRAVGEAGAPLANASISVTPWSTSAVTGTALHIPVTTDAQGLFELSAKLSAPVATTFTCESYGDQRLTGFLSAESLQQASAPSNGEPQDVLFRLPTTLVTGRVVDADGLGVDGLMVHAGPQAVFNPALPFRSDASAETRGGGYFSIKGDLVREPFTVWCRRGKLRGGPVQADAGSQDLVLELYRTQTTRAKLIVDDGFPPEYGTLVLFQNGEPVHADARSQASSSGLLSASAYGSGFYTFVLHYAGAEVARREDVPVGRTEPIIEFDLRGRLQQHTVTLNLPEGTPLRGAVQWRASGTSDPWFGAALRTTELNLASPARAIDLRLQLTGQPLIEQRNWSGTGSLSL